MEELQKLRKSLYFQCGKDIEKAARAYEFIVNYRDLEHKAQGVRDTFGSCPKDGIYFIYDDGSYCLYGEHNVTSNREVKYIGILQGKKSLAVALHNASKKETSLTISESEEY